MTNANILYNTVSASSEDIFTRILNISINNKWKNFNAVLTAE